MAKQQKSYKVRFLGSKQGLLFLLFAALIWVISAFSEKYTAVVPVHVEIENDATDLILLEKQLHVDASMSASGFLFYTGVCFHVNWCFLRMNSQH